MLAHSRPGRMFLLKECNAQPRAQSRLHRSHLCGRENAKSANEPHGRYGDDTLRIESTGFQIAGRDVTSTCDPRSAVV